MATSFDRIKTALADHYEIERELGHGAMATVYLARDLKLNRQVAVKVLIADLSFALGPERFRREIDLATRLSQDNSAFFPLIPRAPRQSRCSFPEETPEL